MHHAIWKLTALAGVVGMGLLVVMQAQKGIIPPDGAAPDEQVAGGAAGETQGNHLTHPKAAANRQVQGVADAFGPEDFREEPVPASAKTLAGRRATPADDNLDITPVKKRSAPVDADPFETPDTAPPKRAGIPVAGVSVEEPADEVAGGAGESATLPEETEFTPIKPRTAAPDRELALEDSALDQRSNDRRRNESQPLDEQEPREQQNLDEQQNPINQQDQLNQQNTERQNARLLPQPPEPREAPAKSAPLTRFEATSPEADVDVESPDQRVIKSSPNLRPQASPAAGPYLGTPDEVPPATSKSGNRYERDRFSEVDEKEPAAVPGPFPPEKVSPRNRIRPATGHAPRAATDDEDDHFLTGNRKAASREQDAIREQNRPENSKPAVPDALGLEPANADDRATPLSKETAPLSKEKRTAISSIMGDEEDESTSRKSTRSESPRARVNDERPSAAEPLVERSVYPRKLAQPADETIKRDEAAFEVDRRNRANDAPRIDDSPRTNAASPESEKFSAPIVEPEEAAPRERMRTDDPRSDERRPPRQEQVSQPSGPRLSTPVQEPAPYKDLELKESLPRNNPPLRDNSRNSDGVRLNSLPFERVDPIPNERPQPAQRPHVTIDKIAPHNAVLGQPMIFHIVVKNAGSVVAHQVVVEDRIPDGMQVNGTIPRAELAGSKLIWRLGTLEPGQEHKISVRAIPMSEGVVGSVATVNFAAEVGARTMVTAPRLRLDISGPQRASLGAPVVFNFKVTNVGKGDSSGVIIRNVLPAALKHTDGDDLEYEVGTLPAGESREVQLTLTAAQQGRTVNRAVVTADGGLSVQAEAPIEVVGPSLSVKRAGPKRLFLGKSGVFTNTVTNTGSNPIGNITLVETVPDGLDFVSASAAGKFNSQKRTVTWNIDRLDARQAGSVDITLASAARGPFVSVVRAYDSAGATGEAMGTTNVTGVAALGIDISELAAPVEIGERLSCRIRVFNRGSDSATAVRAAVVIPAGMQVVSVKGPGNYRRTGDQLQFDTIARLDPRTEALIELTLQAASTGDARIQVLVQSEQMTQPLRQEEGTTVVTSQ